MPKKPLIKPSAPFLSPILFFHRLLAGTSGLWLPSLPPLPVLSGSALMLDFAEERTTIVSKLRRVRWVSFLLGFWNIGVVLLGAFLMSSVLSACSAREKLPVAASALFSVARIVAMVGAGKAQHETAEMIASYPFDSAATDATVRRERRLRYKRWLWWTRIGMAVTVLQFIGAVYLTFMVVGSLSYDGRAKICFLGQYADSRTWRQILVLSFLVLVWLVVIIQCFTGSDILRWRSFYATHDTAWKAHYREVFDHGIREALCCLGRVKYLSVLEEDEVYSVARLLGDLVAYRASGTGHLELLAGLALLQSHKQSVNFQNDVMEAPVQLIQEAAFYHQFAEAAYTGPLLDFGRNPILFPCAWLYRQGVFTPWTRNSRPSLEGDNWWRGHAAAFLKYVNLPPEALRRGRVSQTKREAAYFIVVLHDQRSVVIAVRGTETPEDLITDGLCRECALTAEDLDGLINCEHLPSIVKNKVMSSFPHYGHAGIVESARELFMQIDGQSGDNGFLSSLLGEGCECHGYEVHIVGHSLGGAIATHLGLRLYGRYPNLNVYAYGTLPCLDLVIAEACSVFVTTIVYNDEFSARLSVNSIHRLRAAAINALSDDSLANSAMIQKLARRILHANKYHENGEYCNIPASSFRQSTSASVDSNYIPRKRHFSNIIIGSHQTNKELNLAETSLHDASDSEILVSLCDEYKNSNPERDQHSFDCETHNMTMSDNIKDQTPLAASSEIPLDPPEMFLPGRIVHIVRETRRTLPFWSWKVSERERVFRALMVERESFKDISVTPFMFIDHLPWRCHYAMQRVLQARKSQGHITDTSAEKDLAC